MNAQSLPSSHKLDFFFGQVFLKALKLLLSAENLLGKFSFYD